MNEISLISSDIFDKLEFIARSIRETEKPFGGIQLVLSGDWLQLPNVDDKDMHSNQNPGINVLIM